MRITLNALQLLFFLSLWVTENALQLPLLRLRVTEKTLQLPLYFFFFSFSPVLLGSFTIMFYLCLSRLQPKKRMTSFKHFALDTLKKHSVTNIPVIATYDAYARWDAMCFSLFKVTSIHSISKRIRDSKLRNKIEGETLLFYSMQWWQFRDPWI